MNPKTRVIVCGSSIYMASLAAGLQSNLSLEVRRIMNGPSCLPESPLDLSAEVIIFDLAEVRADVAVALIRERPNLLIFGMDPNTQDLLVLSGHSAQAQSVADLVKIIALAQRQEEAWQDLPPNIE